MSFGFDRQPRVAVGSSVDLSAFLYQDQEFGDNETPVPATQISSATFTIQRPQDPALTYVTVSGSAVTIADGVASCTVPANEQDTPGQYLATCTFVYGPTTHTEKTRVVTCDYDVFDPFERSGAQPYDPMVDMAWNRLADLFDSEEGGPWLRDMTKGRFDKTRMREFINDVFFDINNQMPLTSLDPNTVDYTQWEMSAVVAQGILVHSIRHLMRSYAEQPVVSNSPVGFFDRQTYLDRWTAIYNIENERYEKEMIPKWKSRYFNQGTKSLVSAKSGRGLTGSLRSRGVFRGYY